MRKGTAHLAPLYLGPSSLLSSTFSHQQQKQARYYKLCFLGHLCFLVSLYFCLTPATPGSDSPGQAMEAEEIMKQLDIEQAEEMPSSTLTSTESISLCHGNTALPQRLHISSDAIEEGEIVTETDMPPLTGRSLSNTIIFAQYTVCNVIVLVEI